MAASTSSRSKRRKPTEYAWTTGAVFGLSATVVAREFLRLKRVHGALTPAVILSEARKRNSLLHPAFDWDDASAAHRHRLDIARRMLVSVRIVSVGGDGQPQFLRVHIHTRDADGGGVWVSPEELLADEAMYEYALDEAIKMLKGTRERFRFIRELADIFNAIDTLG